MPPKGTKKKRRNGVGSRVKRCGDYGGRNVNGKPCRKESNQLCWRHGGEGPEALNDEIMHNIVGALRARSYLETAAEAQGLSVNTVRDWIRKGEADPASPYGEFARKIQQARAFAEMEAMKDIHAAGSSRKSRRTKVRVDADGKVLDKTVEEHTDGDWRASAWYMERAFPDRWKKDVGSMNRSRGDSTKQIRVTEIRERYTDEKPDTGEEE